MRPKTIIWFEVIFFATLLLGVIQSYLGWETLTEKASVGYILGIQIITVAIVIALVLFISRKKSKVAMWILVIMSLLGLPLVFLLATSEQLAGSGWITLVQTIGQLFAVALLFFPASRTWMSKKTE